MNIRLKRVLNDKCYGWQCSSRYESLLNHLSFAANVTAGLWSYYSLLLSCVDIVSWRRFLHDTEVRCHYVHIVIVCWSRNRFVRLKTTESVINFTHTFVVWLKWDVTLISCCGTSCVFELRHYVVMWHGVCLNFDVMLISCRGTLCVFELRHYVVMSWHSVCLNFDVMLISCRGTLCVWTEPLRCHVVAQHMFKFDVTLISCRGTLCVFSKTCCHVVAQRMFEFWRYVDIVSWHIVCLNWAITLSCRGTAYV